MNEVVVTRVFDAPREMVFRAFTEAGQMQQWFAPKGFTTPFCEVDARPGGLMRCCLRSPEGKEYWGRGIYQEVVPPERIVYLDAFTDPEGNLVAPTYYGMSADHPGEALVTITFDDLGGRTRVTLRHAIGAHVPERAGTEQGWTEMLEKLGEYVSRSNA